MLKVRDIGLKEGLGDVCPGNIPGQGGEDTHCYACGALLIARIGYTIRQNHLKDGRCPQCQALIDGVWQ